VKSAVYGGLDGIITSLSIALSGIGSSAGAGVIVALGLSSLIADALSMAVADYLATKTDDEFMKAE
jgi:VIT1/CCC1 family predicted Fe2+/Mn2+ transporter